MAQGQLRQPGVVYVRAPPQPPITLHSSVLVTTEFESNAKCMEKLDLWFSFYYSVLAGLINILRNTNNIADRPHDQAAYHAKIESSPAAHTH